MLARRRVPVMTGIDRVEFAIAAELVDRVARSQENIGFLVATRFVRGVLGHRDMARLLGQMRMDRGICGPPNALLARVMAVLRDPPEYRARPGARRIADHAYRPPIWRGTPDCALLAARYGETLPGFLARATGPVRYLHASHHGFRQARRFDWLAQPGIEASFFVHDVIPLDWPQYCSAGAALGMAQGLALASRLAARIIVNSAATAERVRAHLAEKGLRTPDIIISRLGCGRLPRCDWGEAVSAPADRAPAPYFLCPGTLEGRKNLGFLLQIWRALAGTVPPAQLPRLVLAGQRGWQNRALLADLDEMRDIAPFVVEVAGLNDAAMASLTDGAQAVLVPSRAEGFSLAVAEALARGRPVLASDIPAHREFADDKLCLLPEDVARWVHRLVSPLPTAGTAHPARSWRAFAADLALG